MALTLEQRQGAIDINVRLKGPFKGLVWVGDSMYVFWARETERWGPSMPPVGALLGYGE